MTMSMYRASVPVFQARLKGLAHCLRIAEANAAERKIDPAVLLAARLAPDMLSLTQQVQIATDHAKGAPSRLAQRDIVRFEDVEKSFPELQARITRTLDLLDTFEPAEIDGSEERTIEIKGRTRDLSFTGSDYLLHFALPNFYFHVTTAYGILRHNGVPLGKPDFLRRD
ncbi:DUF1993 domain-containing protein [Kumtagia ephedrae]|uniref:DUF1993 domain-containing protein n=1 Tax=Kumtagia ephedrae TaxID=2116701 RepID=A0A2P7ST21_9HYPH|nr:DUF1993 domain-containing protein [Mesorhizobium ephedrae]PSJ65601.1 DUF1993 domain-containing protein [Mesorhizobium ephedrae]